MNDETKHALGDAIDKTVEVAEETVQRPGVKKLARLGFYTKGFLFIVIGVLAILLVVGLDGGKLADATGALAAVAQQPFGKVILLVFIAGAIGHGIWNILRGAGDVDDAGTGWQGIIKRSVAIGLGIFYLGLAASATEIVIAARVSATSSQAEETFTSILLAIPLGAVLMVLIGLSLMGAGVNECYSGFTGKFRENYRMWEIKGYQHSFINALGVLSFTARALLLVMTGYFFVHAAFSSEPGGSIGLDAVLLTLLKSSYGRILVLLTAVGLVCHGILAFYEAKYRRIC